MIYTSIISESYTKANNTVINTNCNSFTVINESDANIVLLDVTIAPGKEFVYKGDIGTQVTNSIPFSWATGVTTRKVVVVKTVYNK